MLRCYGSISEGGGREFFALLNNTDVVGASYFELVLRHFYVG